MMAFDVSCSASVVVAGLYDHGRWLPWRPFTTCNQINGMIKFDGRRSSRGFLLRCELQSEPRKKRKHSPYLARTLLCEDDYITLNKIEVVPDIWRYASERFCDKPALLDPRHVPPTSMTYKQVEEEILAFSEALRVLGIVPNEKIALFADNSCRWLIADQGSMAMGAINVVRGSRSSAEELLQIYNHSDSVALVVDSPEFLSKIAEPFCANAAFKFVILLWGDKRDVTLPDIEKQKSIYTYNEIIHLGEESRRNVLDNRKQYEYEKISTDDICTIVYTSGTTGNPKGVQLSHKNLMHQIRCLNVAISATPGDRYLSLLPPWHMYERACEYFFFARGIEQMYTSVIHLKDDLQRYQPHYLVGVPLIYESLYSGIQRQLTSSAIRKRLALLLLRVSMAYMEAKRIYEVSLHVLPSEFHLNSCVLLQGACLTSVAKEPSRLHAFLENLWARFVALLLLPLHFLAKKLIYGKIQASVGIIKAGVTGGGSLPSHIDKFFEAVEINLQNGYGLTESSPVIAVRRPGQNVLGSVGLPLPQTEVRIVDAKTGEILPPGSKGIIQVRGPLVMAGYYKNPSATKAAIGEQNWLNTGDLGWIAPFHGRGRSRNCGGVVVIEGRVKDTIVLSTGENVEPVPLEEAVLRSDLISQVVVFGQDQRRVGAILVPNKEKCLVAAKVSANCVLDKTLLAELLRDEVEKWTVDSSVKIGPIIVADEPFTMEGGMLTATMKVQRNKVLERYKEEIANVCLHID